MTDKITQLLRAMEDQVGSVNEKVDEFFGIHEDQDLGALVNNPSLRMTLLKNFAEYAQAVSKRNSVTGAALESASHQLLHIGGLPKVKDLSDSFEFARRVSNNANIRQDPLESAAMKRFIKNVNPTFS